MKGRPHGDRSSYTPADHKPAPRTCLGCGQLFASKGPGNRRCFACKHDDDQKAAQGRGPSARDK